MFTVYDNGGTTLDRYTIVMYEPATGPDGTQWVELIACNTPESFWQHGEGRVSDFAINDKEIPVQELPLETRLALLYELADIGKPQWKNN